MVVVTTSETERCDNVATTLSDVATKIQPKPNVVTTSCASWVAWKWVEKSKYWWVGGKKWVTKMTKILNKSILFKHNKDETLSYLINLTRDNFWFRIIHFVRFINKTISKILNAFRSISYTSSHHCLCQTPSDTNLWTTISKFVSTLTVWMLIILYHWMSPALVNHLNLSRWLWWCQLSFIF